MLATGARRYVGADPALLAAPQRGALGRDGASVGPGPRLPKQRALGGEQAFRRLESVVRLEERGAIAAVLPFPVRAAAMPRDELRSDRDAGAARVDHGPLISWCADDPPHLCVFLESEEGVELRGCKTSQSICPDMLAANSEDWSTEYLDKILSIRIVDDFDQAVDHINKYGSHHSDAIITKDYATAQKFLKVVDSAAVYVNSSTRFTDGYEFGLGAEVGISTQKLHCRGPMGLEGLTSYKYVIYGDGQIRQ